MFGFKITQDLKVYIQYGFKVVDHLFIKCLTTEPNLQSRRTVSALNVEYMRCVHIQQQLKVRLCHL